MEINEGTTDRALLLLRDEFHRGCPDFKMSKGSTENSGTGCTI